MRKRRGLLPVKLDKIKAEIAVRKLKALGRPSPSLPEDDTESLISVSQVSLSQWSAPRDTERPSQVVETDEEKEPGSGAWEQVDPELKTEEMEKKDPAEASAGFKDDGSDKTDSW